jgi:magnesium-protoporphyrin IX monomethyl ester (oxidative) cyclase
MQEVAPAVGSGSALHRSLSLSSARRSKTLAEVMVPGPRTRGLRVALINPPQSYPGALNKEYQSYLPVGLAMLAAVLQRMGSDVKIIDCLAWNQWQVQGSTVVFGMSMEQLRAELTSFAPHIVGVTNPFTAFLQDALAVVRLVKDIDPSIQVILGGIEASLEPNNRELLENDLALDVLVRGEGEVTLCDLISHYDAARRCFVDLEGVEGILYRGANGVQVNPKRAFIGDLDQLPLPAYDLLDLDRMYANPFYARHRMKARAARCLPLHTSRGCPYSCTFCSVHSQVGKANRRHSPDYVVRHMRHVMDRYGVKHFHFEDDNLTLHAARARELFEAIRPLGVSWDTPNGLRADTISAELAELMAASGAKSVTIAVESGDQRVLDEVVRKNLKLEDVVSAAEHLARAEIPTIAFFIVGFPGEGEEQVRTTLEFAKRLAIEHNTLNLLFVATPLPGTPLATECREKNYFVQSMNNETLLSAIRLNQTPLIETESFTKADLFRWAKSVLDTPEIYTMGEHMPFFRASSAGATRMMKKFIGVAESVDIGVPASYWRAPVNNPPPVLARDTQLASATPS